MSKVHFVPFYYIIIYFTKQNKKRQWYVVIKGYQGIEGYEGLHMNDMEGQYKFMVKHVQLWNVAFHSTSPRWIHSVYLAAIAAYYAR